MSMNDQKKLHVGLLYGGQSCEHEVSVISARSILAALDPDRYEVSLLGIAKTGEWQLMRDHSQLSASEEVAPTGQIGVFLDHSTGQLQRRDRVDDSPPSMPELDVIFPVLHGPFGEDGTVQGLLELSGVAYVGSGVTGSAVGMNKAIAKMAFNNAGMLQAKHRVFKKSTWELQRESTIRELEEELEYPMFVKPVNLGSSVGISKVKNQHELTRAINYAAQFDLVIIIEQGLVNCREVEVAVLGNDEPKASVVGEIIPGGEFYDYSDKYINDVSTIIIPAEFPETVVQHLQTAAIGAFASIDAAGLARVDFFVDQKTNQIYINEINTMPGFTPISMYPKLWEASGIGYSELLDRLIQLALERRAQLDQKQLVL